MPRVPTIPVEHLTLAQQRAFMLSDNRLAELAEWNEDVLAAELKELLEFDIDIEVTGFDAADLEQVMAPATLLLKKKEKAELVPEPKRHLPAVSAIGDVWKLGEHRLLCGSALEDASYERLLGKQLVQLVFTTFPDGNVSYGEFGSSGILEGGTDKNADRNVSQSLARIMSLAARYSVDGQSTNSARIGGGRSKSWPQPKESTAHRKISAFGRGLVLASMALSSLRTS